MVAAQAPYLPRQVSLLDRAARAVNAKPAARRPSATPRPTPRLAPVTSATFPVWASLPSRSLVMLSGPRLPSVGRAHASGPAFAVAVVLLHSYADSVLPLLRCRKVTIGMLCPDAVRMMMRPMNLIRISERAWRRNGSYSRISRPHLTDSTSLEPGKRRRQRTVEIEAATLGP